MDHIGTPAKHNKKLRNLIDPYAKVGLPSPRMKLIRTSISLPADEHARLTRLAKSNRRSMSSEILFQLGQVRPSKPTQPT